MVVGESGAVVPQVGVAWHANRHSSRNPTQGCGAGVLNATLHSRAFSLLCSLPNNLPARYGGILLLNAAEHEPVAIETIRTDLTRADVSRIGRHSRKMHDLLVLNIDLISSAVGK